MSGFRVATPSSRPDPFKRVKYSLGMVLGVDEFEQEQAYFLEADRRHTRSLHGYGVVCGLRVTNEGPEVRVSPGLAVSPKGREIRLPAAHCARIDEWLNAPQNRRSLDEAPPHPSVDPGVRSLYVVLCYLECETDDVPIPGTPCRSEEESMAPSRIAESFDLKFSLTPPDQTEEEAIRAFGRLLDRLEISSDPADDAIDPERMADEVRALLDLFPTDGSEPGAPGDAPLFVRPDQLDEVLGAALEVWVSEVRPALLPDGKNCVCGPPDEDCILLARVDFTIDDAGLVDSESVRVVQDDRPYLVQTRLLAELLRHTREGVTDHGKLSGLEDDDHPQYLPVDPETRALVQDLNAGGFKIVNLLSGTEAGEAVTADKAVKVDDPAGGDLEGTYPNPRVRALRGAPVVDDASKRSGWVLTWTGSEWRPRPAQGGGIELHEVAGRLPTIPFVTVTRVPRQLTRKDPDRFFPTFELWFHLDVGDESRVRLPRLMEDGLYVEVYAEVEDGVPLVVPVEVMEVRRKEGASNVFLVMVHEDIDAFQEVRFVFYLREMLLELEGEGHYPLLDWMMKRPVKWVGHDGEETITAYYKNDVRQKVVASGTYDTRGRLYVSNNLELPEKRPEVPIKESEFITWGSYNVMKRHLYVIKGVPYWMQEPEGMASVPLFFRVLLWHDLGVFVSSRELGGGTPNMLVGTTVEITEIL